MKFLGTTFDDLGVFTRNDADGDVEPFGENDTGAVGGVEFLPFVASLVIIHAAVGPYAVDVGQDQFGEFHGLEA